ncbi:hypothetical protein C8R45DRAFT_1208720 [Mycena sanguinolenta]|nr:hypothetical protein C8R45DRAFT_1208720 [Mycena sanguinolenta]
MSTMGERKAKPTDRVSLADEPLIFAHSDISLDNFLWDPPMQWVWLVDCGHINVLPPSFFSFYFHCYNQSDPLVAPFAAALDFPVSAQLCLLDTAAIRVMQGIDANGNHTWPRRRHLGAATQTVPPDASAPAPGAAQ